MKLLTTIVLLFSLAFMNAQEKGIVQGTVLDNEMENEPLAFAHVSIKNSASQVSTDLYGTYYMELEPGMYTLVFGFAGYESKEIENVAIEAGETLTIKNILMEALKAPRTPIAAKEAVRKETLTSSL